MLIQLDDYLAIMLKSSYLILYILLKKRIIHIKNVFIAKGMKNHEIFFIKLRKTDKRLLLVSI